MPRWCGGIGRRKGLKIPRGQPRAGSSPATSTEKGMALSFLFLFMWESRNEFALFEWRNACRIVIVVRLFFDYMEVGNMGMQLTENDIKKIQAEIDHRKNDLRPGLLEDIKEAKAQGDLSENFEYYAAKRENGLNERRIRYLERVLRFSEVLEDYSEPDEVGIDNTVEIFMEHTQKTRIIRLVTSIRQNCTNNMISIDSPVGKAILGHKVGERVYINLGEGRGYYLQIRSLDNSTNDEDDEINAY